MRILQVGAYPPPFGGVSVHLMRLHEQLRRRGMDNTIIDLSDQPKDVPGVVQLSWPETTAYLADQPRSVVHFHNFFPGYAGDYGRLARRHVCVLSLHNERFREDLAALGRLRRWRALWYLKRLQCIVVDNRRSQQVARALWGDGAEIHLIPEFIPPQRVPPLDRPEVVALRRRCRFLLASNASRVAVHDGCDLYGLDLLVELLGRLVHERGVDAGLVFLLHGGADAAYLERIRARVRELGLDDRFLIVTEPLDESSSLWRESDVVIRATNTDGSSLTVLEALSLGVPVVASDCVERPEGTVLFRTRDVADLVDRTAEVLADLPAHRQRLREVAEESNVPSFVKLYGDLGRKWMRHES